MQELRDFFALGQQEAVLIGDAAQQNHQHRIADHGDHERKQARELRREDAPGQPVVKELLSLSYTL